MAHKIVIGDDYRGKGYKSTLKLNGLTFVIAGSAIVKAAVVDPETEEVVLGPVTIDKTETGTNLSASLVVFAPTAVETAAATRTGTGLRLHIEVTEGNSKNTYVSDEKMDLIANAIP